MHLAIFRPCPLATRRGGRSLADIARLLEVRPDLRSQVPEDILAHLV